MVALKQPEKPHPTLHTHINQKEKNAMESYESAYSEYSPELESFEFEESEGTGEVFSEAGLMALGAADRHGA